MARRRAGGSRRSRRSCACRGRRGAGVEVLRGRERLARRGGRAREPRRARALVQPRDDELLTRARLERPRLQHAVQALLLRVGGVGDRGDVALTRRSRRGDRHRHHDRVGVRHRRLLQPVLAPRHEQRRRLEAPRLDRTLPDPVAARPVAGGGGVKADCARNRTEKRGRGGRVDHRPRRPACQRARRRAARVDRPRELDRGERPQLPRPSHARDLDRRAGAAQRRRELGVGLPQARGAAQRHDQHVDARHLAWHSAAPWKSPSSRGPSPSADCARPTGSRRGRSSCTRGSSPSPARPTSCRSSARRTRSRPTRPSRRTGGRWWSPGRSRSRRPACCPRSPRRWPRPASRSSPSRPTTPTTCWCARATSSARCTCCTPIPGAS